MLENVKKQVNKKTRKTFEEKYIDYILSVQDKNIELEMQYIRRHNKLDVMRLDKWIGLSLQEVSELC